MTDLREDRKKLRRRRYESAFPKNRLDDHRGNRFGCHHALERVFDMPSAVHFAGRIRKRVRAPVAISIGNAIDIAWKRFEPGFVRMRLTRDCHRHVSTSVECILETDDRWALGVTARDLDGVLDGLSPGIDQNGFLSKFARGKRVQLLTN